MFEIEPKAIDDALSEKSWTMAIHDELNQFTKNNVCWFLNIIIT